MIHYHDEVASTMEMAHQLAEAGAPAGDAVVARRQREGRGQQGRSWSAEVGGLWISVIARPEPGESLGPLSLRVGLAVAHSLELEVPGVGQIGIKWPNDLILRGRKVAGVLSEARWQSGRCLWVVTGVGINVHNPIPRELHEVAITLNEVTDALLPEALAPAMASAISRAMRGGPLGAEEMAEWRRRDALAGRAVATPVEGRAEGVSPDGSLLIRTPSGEQVACSLGVVALPG